MPMLTCVCSHTPFNGMHFMDVCVCVFDLQSVFSNIADYVTGSNDVPQTDIHWFSETGVIDVFVMLGPGPKDVFRQYSALTGTTPLPPVRVVVVVNKVWCSSYPV